VSCWGYNEVGELGNGDTNVRLGPWPIAGGYSVAAIGSGNRHTCAVLADHTVRCWGSNEFGGLGDGTTTDSLVPVAVRLGPGSVPVDPGLLGPNLVPNGDFSNDQTGWQTTTVANDFPQVLNGAFCFAYGDTGTGTLGTTGPLNLTGGLRYEFSFRAWTTIDTSQYIIRVHAKLGGVSPPYVEYTGSDLALTATPATFTQFYAPLTDTAAGIAFITSASYHGTTCFDDVVVRVND